MVVRDYFKEQKMSYKQLTSIKKDSTRAEPF
jgi:hypothetical protein